MVVSRGVGAGDQNPALCHSSWYSVLTTEPSLQPVTLGLTEPEMALHPPPSTGLTEVIPTPHGRGSPPAGVGDTHSLSTLLSPLGAPEFRVPTDSGLSPAVRKATLFTFHPDDIMRRALSFPGQNLPNKVGGLLERWARWSGPSGQSGKGRGLGVGAVPTSTYWEGESGFLKNTKKS